MFAYQAGLAPLAGAPLAASKIPARAPHVLAPSRTHVVERLLKRFCWIVGRRVLLLQRHRQAAEQVVVDAAGESAGPPAPEGFEDFFRDAWRELVRHAMIVGATKDEAEDAASQTLLEMLRRWPVQPHPLGYARRAVVNNYIKARTRGNQRIAQRLIERGHVLPQEGAEDSRLTAAEDNEWAADVLSLLPPAQREVMERIARGHSRDEAPAVLGKSSEAVRRNLCDARARLRQLLHPDGEFKQPGRTTARSREEAR